MVIAKNYTVCDFCDPPKEGQWYQYEVDKESGIQKRIAMCDHHYELFLRWRHQYPHMEK